MSICEETNQAPTAQDEPAGFVILNEDSGYYIITAASLLANDSDPDGDVLTIVGVEGAENGDVSLYAGDVLYRPDPDLFGSPLDVITYTVSDGRGGTATAQVQINVLSQPDGPGPGPDSVVANADTLPTIRSSLGPHVISPYTLTDNDTRSDGGAKVVYAVGDAIGGSVALQDGFIVFTPTDGFVGEASFTYSITSGLGDSATATVTAMVSDANTAPVAEDDGFATSADDVLCGENVLTNTAPDGADSDPDGDPLKVIEVDGEAGNVGQTVAGSHGGVFVIKADGSVSFDPDGDFESLTDGQTATTTVSYTISDNALESTATVTVTVNGANEPPVARDDSFTAPENGPAITGNVITNTVPNGADSDADGSTLTVGAVAGSAGNIGQAVAGSNGGLFTIAANGALSFDANDDFESLNNGQTATTTVTYTVSDGQGGSDTATVTVTVNGAAEPPAIFTSGNDNRNLNSYDLDLYSEAQATRALAGKDVVQLSSSQNLGVEFHGQAGNDTVTGVGGTDRIFGDSNDDVLHGKGGGDTLHGGSGDDRLFGDAGADHLYGGGGDDIFVFATGDVNANGKQTDVVHDFVDGEDKLGIGGLAWDGRRGQTDPLDDAGVSVTDTGAGTLIAFTSGATVTAKIFLEGFGSELLDRADFVF